MRTSKRGPKVVILCGGLGTRMREETEFRPKPMVEVGGQPILWHIMKIYAAAGLTDFVCCLGYRGQVIKQYFIDYRAHRSSLVIELASGSVEVGNGGIEDWRVALVDTGETTMTGGRVKRVADQIDTDLFCCTYGDGLADIDVQELIAFHRSHGKLATVTGVRPPGRFGELHLEGDAVRRFAEKPAVGKGIISGGFFVFNREVLERWDNDPQLVLEQAPLEELAAADELQVFRHDGFWQPADTLKDVELLRSMWASGDAPWQIWKDGVQ